MEKRTWMSEHPDRFNVGDWVILCGVWEVGKTVSIEPATGDVQKRLWKNHYNLKNCLPTHRIMVQFHDRTAECDNLQLSLPTPEEMEIHYWKERIRTGEHRNPDRISPGDDLLTGYSVYTVVRVSKPFLWRKCSCCGVEIFKSPAVSLSVHQWNEPNKGRDAVFSEVCKNGSSYFDSGHEIWFRTNGKAVEQLDLFSEPSEQPYPFQSGVEYVNGRTWRCERCGIDFNAEKTQVPNPYCPHCDCPVPARPIYLHDS